MPDWTPEGWDVADYAFDGNEQATALSLHHCVDDDVVPHAHLASHARKLSSARVFTYEAGGHQFEGVDAAELLR